MDRVCTAFPLVSLVSVAVTLVSVSPMPAHAQKAAGAVRPAPEPALEVGEVNLSAASANVSESGSPVTIRILRWSTDEERNPVVAALTPSAPVTAPAGGGARGGRGGARRGAAGGAGGAPNPIAALTAAIDKAPTIGYIWTRDITGYAIKYAYHGSLPDGGERIVLATNRRLGGYSPAWNPVAGQTVTDYEFTLIEIRLDARGRGEGKTSVTTKVVADNDARTVALENYAATPALLQNVSR